MDLLYPPLCLRLYMQELVLCAALLRDFFDVYVSVGGTFGQNVGPTFIARSVREAKACWCDRVIPRNGMRPVVSNPNRDSRDLKNYTRRRCQN